MCFVRYWHTFVQMPCGHGVNVANFVILSNSNYLFNYFSTGEIASVAGTANDFRSAALLGDRIPQVFGAPGFPGFDLNYCLSACPGDTAAATLVHRDSGRVLRVFTDQPGLQLYTGNHHDGIPGKLGASYGQHSSIALETQNYPDAIHHVSSALLLPPPQLNSTQV